MLKSGGHIDRDTEVITVQNVSKSFGDLHVLRGVDLHLFKGENLVVLGRSGTGKSVLIKRNHTSSIRAKAPLTGMSSTHSRRESEA